MRKDTLKKSLRAENLLSKRNPLQVQIVKTEELLEQLND